MQDWAMYWGYTDHRSRFPGAVKRVTPQPSAQHPRPSGTPVPPLFPGPLTFGEIFSRGFSAVARNPKPLVLWAMLVPFAVYLLFAIPMSLSDTTGVSAPASLGLALLALVTSIIYSVVSTLGGAVVQGYVASNVKFEALGHRGTSAELWSTTRPVLGKLIGFGGLVIGFVIAVSIAASIGMFLVIMLAAMFMTVGAPGAAIVLGILVSVGALIPILWLAARISLAPVVIVCERATAWGALHRSWQLTRGRSWRVVGLVALLGLIYLGAIVVLGLLVWPLTQALVPGASWETGFAGTGVLAEFLFSLPALVSGAALMPVSAAALANVYLDARTRQDPLAASLHHYHAARAAGYAPAQLADPFVTVPPGSHLG